MRMLLTIAAIALCACPVWAEDYASLNEQGNVAYRDGKFDQALDYYRQAEAERPETPEIFYNEANALSETGDFEEAVEKYQKALNTDDVRLQQQIYYNGGNNYFRQEDFRQAIEWYQKALELNPEDIDAKYNLELARNRLREQMERQPQDQQQQDQQQNQQQQNQQEQQEPEPQQQQQEQQQQQQPQEQDQDQGDEQSQQGEEEDQQEQQAQEQPKPDEMSKEDALRILRALEEKEEENLKDAKRFKVQGSYRGNDW